VLHYYLDLPLPEVAATLGVPLGTAKSRLGRGLTVLRRALSVHADTGLVPEEARR
jgi:DNA-directed RNA polymerase specialized sigma24 family protein